MPAITGKSQAAVISDLHSNYIFASPADSTLLLQITIGDSRSDAFGPFLLNGDYQWALNLILDGDDLLIGTSFDDHLLGFAGNDTFFDGAGVDRYDGGSGIDTLVYDISSKSSRIGVGSDGVAIVDRNNPDEFDTAINIEFVKFSDATTDVGTLVRAQAANADQYQHLLELYIGYLNRAPDAFGIAYWASRLVDGATLDDVARSFFESDEAAARRQAGQSAAEIVSKAYVDVLNRVADQGGLDYWVGQLESGQLAMDRFALAFVNGVSAGSHDSQTLAFEKILGGYYSLVFGLTDVADAVSAMNALEQTPGTSTEKADMALKLVESFAVAAEQPDGFNVFWDLPIQWDIPTRDLQLATFYTSAFESYLDRYRVDWPYW